MSGGVCSEGPAACLSKDSEKYAGSVAGPVCEQSLRTGFDVYFPRSAPGREAPGAEIHGVQGDAEEIGGNETELGGAGTNDANDGAIDGADHPALPELLAEQDGADNSQNARDVIQTNGLE